MKRLAVRGRNAARWLRSHQIGKALFAFFVALMVSLFDPLGLGSATEARSSAFLYKVLSPFYPEQAQSAITTILIDDPSTGAGADR